MFVIGNVEGHDKLDNIAKEVTYGGGGYKLYGVKFPFVKESDSIDPSKGERLYNAIGLNFTPTYTDFAGIDDFVNLENGKSPFGVKECATKYNASTGKQEIMTYKGQSDWESAIADPEHNRMIEFPKFYYKRPSETEWVVSKDPFPGSSPSPMHYRNGVLYDKWYVSKYVLGSVDDKIKSQTGLDAFYEGNSTNLPKYRRMLKEEGLYMFDYASYCTIIMLILIKYGMTCIYPFYSYGGYNTTIGTTDEYGLDGCTGSINGNPPDGDSVILGLEKFINDNKYQCLADGIYLLGYDIYINTDIENISLENPGAENHVGYMKANNYNVAYGNSRFGLSSNFPFAILNEQQPIAEHFTFNQYSPTHRYLVYNTNGKYYMLHAGYCALLSHVFGTDIHHFRSQCHL